MLALLLLPAALLASMLASLPAAKRTMQASLVVTAAVEGLAPLRSRSSRFAAFERAAPPIAMSRTLPRVPAPDFIALPVLTMPVEAPPIPGDIRLIALAMPTAAPAMPGGIVFTPLTLATAPPAIPAPPVDPVVSLTAALPRLVLPLKAPVIASGGDGNQCVAGDPTAAARPPVASTRTADPRPLGERIADAAIAQTRDLVIYNARYVRIAFPLGDVKPLFGVCSDVIVRAYRAVGIDLQELVQRTRSGRGDANIDHRRTEVLRQFFAVHGERLAMTDFAEDYLPGDIVTYYRPQNSGSTSHIAIVTNVAAPSGRPMIVHNRGWGPQLEDALFVDQMTGHYRFDAVRPGLPPPAAAAIASVAPGTGAARTAVARAPAASAAAHRRMAAQSVCQGLTPAQTRVALANACPPSQHPVRAPLAAPAWTTADRAVARAVAK